MNEWFVWPSAVGVLCAAMISLVGCAGVAADRAGHPRLFFGREDVPALREKIRSGAPAKAWEAIRKKADEYVQLDPTPVVRYANERKFNSYVRELGFAWVLSGEQRYGRRAIEMMLNWAKAGPPYPYWEGHHHDRGDVLLGLALAYDWTYELMSPQERRHICRAMATFAEQVHKDSFEEWWGTGDGYNNWTAALAGGYGLAALAIEGETGAPDKEKLWIQGSADLVEEYLNADYGVDGECFEGMVYCNYGLSQSTSFVIAYERRTGKDLLTPSRARKAIHYFLYSLLPDGRRMDAHGNSRYRTVAPPIYCAWMLQKFPQDGLVGWFWDNFVLKYSLGMSVILWDRPHAVTPPAERLPLVKNFRDFGLICFRTGWGSGDLLSAFNTQQTKTIDGGKKWLTAYHLHDAVLAFTIYAGDARFAVSPGYGHWPTDLHSCILIDGKGQEVGVNNRHAGRHGETLGFVEGKAAALAVGSAPRSYPGTARALRYYAMAGRDTHRPYFICIDDIQKEDAVPHAFQWQLVTDTNNELTTQGDLRARVVAPNGSRLDVAFVHPADIKLQVGAGQATGEDGNLSVKKLRAQTKAVNPYYMTVMVPSAKDAKKIPVSALEVTGGIGARVGEGKDADIILFRTQDNGPVSSGRLSTDARMLIFSHTGHILARSITRLTVGGRVLLDTAASPADLTRDGVVAPPGASDGWPLQ